ncbi:PTS system, fructose-specific IIB component [Halogeometricum rufum]|jgi:PTS system fructose-specific IIB component|uniref:PTS system, fructose-specific IIB component n=1 Tax=Halogeometricum rufum TaxID=553469 RepID=A0A1I6H098_9EURY|nr:PTS fructose transporter subunit IIB [Halogeometricum rufum]SFR47865.1 PTS system, fructose-specific IIB component [Halogeometricum rufum]
MKLVAVTACPTGIAHSQMAAENLEQTAERLGHEIKVEVQGAMGAENELTADDVADADAVIIASDTAVSRDRFEGKPLVKGTVKDGVNDAEGLVERAAELVENDETGTVEVGGGEATDAGDDEAASETAATETQEPQQRRRGGDREKGLFARLKKLFS